MNRFLISVLLMSVVIGCGDKHEKTEPIYEVHYKSLAPDFKIPKAIYEQLEKSLGKDFKGMPEYTYTGLKVQLSADYEGILSHKKIMINLPYGGGVVDLKDYLVGEGSFYLSFPKEQFGKDTEVYSIFYLSEAPKIKIEDEEFGLGCGQWLDLTSKISSLQKIDFLKVNTTEKRYLYVLSGQYVFVLKKGNQFVLTHANIIDSRFDDNLCTKVFKVK